MKKAKIVLLILMALLAAVGLFVTFKPLMLIYGKEATTQIENSVPYYSVSKWSSNTKMLLLHFHAP